MSGRNFKAMLEARWSEGKFVCVGLDSDYKTIIKDSPYKDSPDASVRWPSVHVTIVNFNRAIVKTTKDLVCAYKPNIAFYEMHGGNGLEALKDTIADIHTIAPDVPVILDAKRGDIGNTNAGYVEAVFGFLQADAITVHPYLGAEAMQPFLEHTDKGIFVLCRTSNLGADEFQDLSVCGEPLFCHIARHVANRWNKNGNCGLVVGATRPNELREVRSMVGDIPILIPGVGAQNGDVEKSVFAGKDSRNQGMIFNASRSVIFASSGPDFAEAARRETLKLHQTINKYRSA